MRTVAALRCCKMVGIGQPYHGRSQLILNIFLTQSATFALLIGPILRPRPDDDSLKPIFERRLQATPLAGPANRSSHDVAKPVTKCHLAALHHGQPPLVPIRYARPPKNSMKRQSKSPGGFAIVRLLKFSHLLPRSNERISRGLYSISI
jgi:hypothetical protein